MDLGRDIAVKILRETHQGKAELVQRFVEEAQISGQLQHPGVVPVYELGQFADKRPYFTMKLVKARRSPSCWPSGSRWGRAPPRRPRPRRAGNPPPKTYLVCSGSSPRCARRWPTRTPGA